MSDPWAAAVAAVTDAAVDSGRLLAAAEAVEPPTLEAAPVATDRSIARVALDLRVLTGDLCGAGLAHEVGERLRAHGWIEPVIAAPTAARIQEALVTVVGAGAADAWAAATERMHVISVPRGDHPALAAAYRGGARHLVTDDEAVLGAEPGATLGPRVGVSARTPAAFLQLYDPAAAYEALFDDAYPGPDAEMS
ncbi:MAG: hypothetical protein RI531_05230 [Haloferacaceae archaeon]|nr:hypothetical protein [Haloferacaceae archaeon]